MYGPSGKLSKKQHLHKNQDFYKQNSQHHKHIDRKKIESLIA